jgi:uncharacterized protein YbdZ (MbtH family)
MLILATLCSLGTRPGFVFCKVLSRLRSRAMWYQFTLASYESEGQRFKSSRARFIRLHGHLARGALHSLWRLHRRIPARWAIAAAGCQRRNACAAMVSCTPTPGPRTSERESEGQLFQPFGRAARKSDFLVILIRALRLRPWLQGRRQQDSSKRRRHGVLRIQVAPHALCRLSR